MKEYAIIENDKVINVVLALSANDIDIPDNLDLIEVENDSPWIGWEKINGVFVPPQPYPSWSLVNNEWVAPEEKPEDGKQYVWNEEELLWERVIPPQPYPSWILDENDEWQPPVPLQEGENPTEWSWNEEEQEWERMV